MRRSLRAAGVGRHESGPSSSDHQDPVSPPIAPPSWVPDPPPMDPGECIWILTLYIGIFRCQKAIQSKLLNFKRMHFITLSDTFSNLK